jgi:hypothetical protein
MVRTGRPRRTPRRFWSEIGVSAGVLLVPPILIGGAVYGLLPAHDDGAARGSAPAALESQPADFNSRVAFDSALDEPRPAVAAVVPPATNAFGVANPAVPATPTPVAPAAPAAKPAVPAAASKPAAAAKADTAPAKPAAAPVKVAEPTTFSLASEHSEPVGKVPRVLGPVPVQVTVVVAPNAGEGEGGEAVASVAPPSSIAAPPPAPTAAPPAAAPVRSTEAPREHRAGAPHTARSHFRHMARRSQTRPETHPDEHATQRAADPPQHEFSQRKLFQDQGGRQKGAVRG